MTLSAVARLLGRLSRFLRDLNAIQRGKVGPRLYNRAVGRGANSVMRKVWKR